jgi:hypothetical protein
LDPWRKLVALNSPFWGVAGNAFYLLIQNYAPPYVPWSKEWNQTMEHFTQTRAGLHFASFQDFCQMPTCLSEQTSGLGLILCLLVPASIYWTWRWRRKNPAPRAASAFNWQTRLLWWTPWGLLLLFMAKVGTIETARLLSPYYPFLFPLMLVQAGTPVLVRQRWWQRFALLAMTTTAILLLMLPSRPLWPAGTILNQLARQHPEDSFILHLKSFYSGPEIDGLSRNAFAAVLPANEPVIGYATDIRGLEPGLWRPFYRRVERVLPDDSRPRLDALGIRYVVVDPEFLTLKDCSIEQLMQQYDARLVERLVVPMGWKAPPIYVYLIRLNSTPAS